MLKKSLNIWKKKKRLYRAGNRDGLIAACLYNACKQLNAPRITKEIEDIRN